MTRTPISRLVCFLGLWLGPCMTMAAQAQTTQLFAFACQGNSCLQGSEPQALVQGLDGNFYGVTSKGGSAGVGTIFELTPGGQFTSLFSFNGTNGSGPGFSLVEAKNGTLWGTTSEGGQFNRGVVFRIKKDGSGFQVVHNFPAKNAEFFFDVSLVAGKDGNIYGSSPGGGILQCGGYGCGTIFRINTKTNAFTSLHLLNGTSDGSNPSGLIQASDGNFYGVATYSVFRVTPTGKYQVMTTLPSYAYTDGSGAGGVGVIQASNGNLFGVIEGAGAEAQLYEVTLGGTGLKVFAGISAIQSSVEVSNLLQAADGSLWLTSYGVPQGDKGSVVQLSSLDGSMLQNIPFDGADGSRPVAPLIQGSDGNLHGTTVFGGTVSSGTASGVVFSVSSPAR